MNQTLYENIKNELNNLQGEASKPKNVSELLGKYLLGKNINDRLSVLIAFYEYMHEKSEISNDYAFVKTDKSWIEYYQRNISNCFPADKIRNDITDIVYDKKLTNIILNVCSDDVKKVFYEASNNVIPSFDVEEKNLQNINAEKQKDELLTSAASSLGVDTNTLAKAVKEEGISSIDAIKIDRALLDKLSSQNSIAARISSEKLGKLKSRLLMFNLEFNIINVNDLTVLEITKKENIFDKIARCPNEVILSMRTFVNNKKQTLDRVTNVALENVKTAIINANEKIRNSAFINSSQNRAKIYRYVSDKFYKDKEDESTIRKAA